MRVVVEYVVCEIDECCFDVYLVEMDVDVECIVWIEVD